MSLPIHRKWRRSFASFLSWKSISISILAALAAQQSFAGTFSVTTYGAACNSNGVSGGGTDDTPAFNTTVINANKAYVSSNVPQTVVLPAGQPCRVDGTVMIGSGVIFEGPGTIVVTAQTAATLNFQNADFSGVENLTIDVTGTPLNQNSALAPITWTDAAGDTAAHVHFFARNNTVTNGNWGIQVVYDHGSGSLQDVDISGNTVTSSSAYSNYDGIHVGGKVSAININGNRVINRADAAIALSTEPGSAEPGGTAYVLSQAVVSNNTCINDLVGLDNSAATNTVWSNNYVQAITSTANVSNPAARVIPYEGNYSVNVKFIGNFLQNFQGTGTDVAAKVDNGGSGNAAVNVDWIGNTIVGASSMWIAANTVALHDNTFSDGANVDVVYDGGATVLTQNIMFGFNYWLGSGTINSNGNASFYSNNSLAHQQANGTITVNGTSNFRAP